MAVGILPACSPRVEERPPILAEDLQEVAFRYLMREYSPERIHSPAAVLCLRHGERRPLDPAMEAYRREHPPDPDREVVGRMYPLTDMPPPFLERFAEHGRPAIVYAVSDPEPLPDGRVLMAVAYYAGGLHAQGDSCVLEWSGGEWRVERCRITWVS